MTIKYTHFVRTLSFGEEKWLRC